MELTDEQFVTGVIGSKAQDLTPQRELILLAEFLVANRVTRFDVNIFKQGSKEQKIGKFVWIPEK